MYQKFDIVDIVTDLIEKKISIYLTMDADKMTVMRDSVYLSERDSSNIVNCDIAVSGKKIELLLKEWPVPNTEYLLMVQKGIMSVTEEELSAGMRRRIVFPSEITSFVSIISPSDGEKIKSLDLAWKEVAADSSFSPVNSFYLEIATDNAFNNVVKATFVDGRTNISLTDLNEERQYYLRIRAQVGDQYGRWSETAGFLFAVGSASSQPEAIGYVTDLEITSVPESGITPTEIRIETSSQIDASSVVASLKKANSITTVQTAVSIDGSAIVLTPTSPLEDNSVYTVNLKRAVSVDGLQEINDYLFDITTNITPMYCETTDVQLVLGEYYIPAGKLMLYIKEASLHADFINERSITEVTFEVRQFVKYKAARDALAALYLLKASNGGVKGLLGEVSYEYANSFPGIKDMLSQLDKQIKEWEYAIRGYYNEGRVAPVSAVRGSKSQPTTNSITSLTTDTSRSTPMNGGI